VEAVETVRPAGGADRPLNGVLSSERGSEVGVAGLRSWKAALEDYMASAGLAAGASVL
jgi:hypothetical protein